MLFNSISFLIFFPIFFILYWFVFNKKLSQQNAFILVASYVFYAFWDYRFCGLLLFSTALDFFSGWKISISSNAGKRKFWLILTVGINLGLLFFFKYFNFFIDTVVQTAASFGLKANLSTLNIILPVGISFYTFHGLSYVFDIYNKKIPATKRFVDYAVFVAFFPLLVAGPIERAQHLLPEFKTARKFSYATAVVGMRQIIWGLFKKVVIADNCATYVDHIFGNYESLSSISLVLGILLFSVQIYTDFSGYTDIAAGISRLLGFEILKNFNFPYFSRSIAEFWKRWHISLTSWFRDYVYIPLGGNRQGLRKQLRNVLIIFLLSGFWHGANMTFIFWGLLHALFFIPFIFSTKRKKLTKPDAEVVSIKDWYKIIATNIIVMLAWTFFRSETIGGAFSYLKNILVAHPVTEALGSTIVFSFLSLGIALLFVVEWISRRGEFGLSILQQKFYFNNRVTRGVIYTGLCFLIIVNLPNEAKSFIYFQF